ncbi:hypothetical protein ACHHRT_01125 [Desulfurivibrio sp. D14AmB]|uniref:hypothetical protein n=1 Tax=Desulfurivibrio sp. D14AmB TaxID=3374370 RepID=UPI00376F3150
MKIFPIAAPIDGEQVLAIQPPLARHPQADWRQRLEYFTGRALTHDALRLEQRHRDGRLATLGQSLMPGVVTGLEVAAAKEHAGAVLEIAAGMGLAASGEIVHLNRNQRVRLDDIRVYAPAAVLGGEEAEGAWRLGDTLAELRAAERPLPLDMVLVLQPVAVEHYGQEPSTDPCDYDVSDEAFENWQWLDGCRLVLYAWNSRLGPGNWRRNRVAYALFDWERRLGEGEFLPWLALGVPIALIGLDSSRNFEFIDRNAVVRRGGELRGGAVPVSPAGDRFLWQAQFEQFNEQLADWLLANRGLDPAQRQATEQFRHLPPAGVLVRSMVDPRRQVQHFFPAGYAVRALAVPYEQLDLAITESAGLLPYDLNTPDRVEVLVPVPQPFYDPQLLVVETLDPEFEQSVARLVTVRDQWLGRRLVVRNIASALQRAIKGQPLLYPLDDPQAVDSLEQAIPFEQALVQEGDRCRYLKGVLAPPPSWLQNGFDDSKWQQGATAIGYGSAGLATELADMPGGYLTIFIRHRFNLAGLAEARRYSLRVITNGGFYAYLNGRQLSSANVSRPLFNAPAAGEQELVERLYPLGELVGRLREGENLLAIQAHNFHLRAERFQISVALLDTEDRFGTVEMVYDKVAPPFGQQQYEVEALAELRRYLDEKTPLAAKEVAQLDEIGIEAYIEFLQRKIEGSDDRVDFGFLRLRTDMYRVRQMMLGNEAGTKLATSPVLAEIAKGASAVATKNELSDFYQRLKQTPKISPEGDGGSGGTVSREVTPTAGTTGSAAGVGTAFLSGELSGGYSAVSGGSAGILQPIYTLGGSNLYLAAGRDAQAKYAVSSQAVSSAALFAAAANPQEVMEQSPVIGMMQSFKNVTVGERLEEPSANVSYLAGLAVKGELLGELLATDLNLDDLTVPGVDSDGQSLTFAQLRADASILPGIMAGQFDPVQGDDEAAYFNAGIKVLESTAGLLRLIEGRIHAYRRAQGRCREVLAQIRGLLIQSDRRLKVIGDQLAEARHDVVVAKALKAEELARLEALNSRRDQVLATQVPFLLFRRPRAVDPRLDVPLHYLNPDLSDQPLPLCDLEEVETPEALAAMLEVVREAPVKWFTAAGLVLPQLSRLADLHITLAGAKKRAASRVAVHPFMKTNFQTPDALLQGLGQVLVKSQQQLQLVRNQTAALDLAALQRLGWQESLQRVGEVVSLGDLIDGSHGRLAASRRAAEELAMIARVATCLYHRFSDVATAIRLEWATRLSQYDAPVNLRNLFALPRFGELGYRERYELQQLVDWLFGRFDPGRREAQELVNDLLRVALLVASQAPVNMLIAGHLPAPVTVRPGSRFTVVADLSRVRVGMAISLGEAGATLVRGKVVDIAGGQVAVEVQTTVGASVELAAGTRVSIGERLGMTFSR